MILRCPQHVHLGHLLQQGLYGVLTQVDDGGDVELLAHMHQLRRREAEGGAFYVLQAAVCQGIGQDLVVAALLGIHAQGDEQLVDDLLVEFGILEQIADLGLVQVVGRPICWALAMLSMR